MDLSVATNWDKQLLANLKNFHGIHSVYGKLDSDLFGGGRPSYLLPRVDREYVRDYVEQVHEMGVKFAHLMNPQCLDNLEYTAEFQASINQELKWINQIGIDGFKIIERFDTTETLTHTVRAYTHREYRGNLADILNIKTRSDKQLPVNVDYFLQPGFANIRRLKDMEDTLYLSGQYIDNQALYGFVEFFKNKDCYASSCDECGFKAAGNKPGPVFINLVFFLQRQSLICFGYIQFIFFRVFVFQ